MSDFTTGIKAGLADPQIRSNIRFAMDGLMAKRKAAFPDEDELDHLRTLGAKIKADALSRLPELLEQLETNCQKNGIQVHWAETTAEANGIVLDIMRRHNASRMIKGKSMVSEEMELNHFLESHEIEALETDLGEFIIQLDGERPSHIIAPAIHKNRTQIAQLLKEHYPELEYTEDIEALTHAARTLLRKKFHAGEIGLSGVNFAVAETGTICLVENEGNGRMCTTIPPVHIAVTGIEKVISTLDQIPPLLSLLTRSAAGQPISTYFNMISSPRKPGERDGPDEVHLILLDNGRSTIYSDPELIETLRCIRCGSCMNHCPVYTRIGGHAYPSTIPGPIGSILEPQKSGLDQLGELPTASTLCGACGEACPVRIPIPKLLNRLRFDGVRQDHQSPVPGAGSQRKTGEAIIWRGWAWLHSRSGAYRFFIGTATRLGGLMPKRFGSWTRTRTLPKIGKKSLHQIARKEGFKDE